jgi:hypothetical protein
VQDGTLTERELGADPRFGVQAPVLTTTTTVPATPGPHVLEVEETRTATTDTGDPFTLLTLKRPAA